MQYTLHHRSSSPGSKRIPLLNRIPDTTRKHLVAILGEFAGTVLFLFFAFAGVQIAQMDGSVPTLVGATQGSSNVVGTPSNTSQLVFIALSFGVSLAVTAWIFFRVSGSLFNPAVTLGMCLIGEMPIIRGILITITQFVGGIVAAALCSALFPGPLQVGTLLGGGTSIARGVFIEMFLTALLVLAVFMLAAEKHKSTPLAPVGIGLAEFIAMIAGVYYTGASLNPARSLGPCVVSRSFPGYHWIYWVGPLLGSLLATGFYALMKALDYESVLPDQDRTLPKTDQNGKKLGKDLESGAGSGEHYAA